MGATGNVTDPGMSEAISGIQQRQEVFAMPEKPSNKEESCQAVPGAPSGRRAHGSGVAALPTPVTQLASLHSFPGLCLSVLEKDASGLYSKT
jgi:hypothetical protein